MVRFVSVHTVDKEGCMWLYLIPFYLPTNRITLVYSSHQMSIMKEENFVLYCEMLTNLNLLSTHVRQTLHSDIL